MKKQITLLFLMSIVVALRSQTAIGSFNAHIPQHAFISLASDQTSIYAAANNGIMILEKNTIFNSEPTFHKWTKVEGLSDIDIAKIHHDDTYKALIICYNNGNIDVIQDDKLINIRDVKDKSITASKQIQNCRTMGDCAYLVYPFGVVLVDMREWIITDTWFTKRGGEQLIATDIALFGGRYYVSTDKGVFSIQASSTVQSDFSQWQPENEWNISFLTEASGQLFGVVVASDINQRDTLCVKTQSGWSLTDHAYLSVRQLSNRHDTLIVCTWDAVQLLDPNMENIYQASWYKDGYYPDARACLLEGDAIWVADHVFGLVYNNMTYYTNRFFSSSGPYTDYVESVVSHNGVVAVSHGSRKGSSAYSPAFKYPVISWYQNQEWQYNDLDFLQYDPQRATYDLNGIAINPRNASEWAVASWGNGLFLCKDHRPVEHYNARNSILDSTSNGLTQVSGVQYDKKGNLWMTNSGCTTMLKMLEPDGTWHSYNIGNGQDGVVAEHLLVDSRGYKWVNFPREFGMSYHLVAFTENGTYDNKGDDRIARIDMNVAAEVSSSTVYCMAEDLDGEIWIGTDKGVKVIYYPSHIFDGNVFPRNILLEQDGYVSVLLEYEEVTAIAVDGANRKWIGTSKAGVFLMSENGQEQLLHFTAEDNPLFSNQIIDINVNQFTGEVFFATSKGLVSYKGTATSGFETYADLPVYPNPVPHEYTGVVAVNGLKTNSLCKITDSSGKLVWQGYSDGGQLAWYCKDHFGRRPATGVYYVMASDDEGKEKIVTKFVFIH